MSVDLVEDFKLCTMYIHSTLILDSTMYNIYKSFFGKKTMVIYTESTDKKYFVVRIETQLKRSFQKGFL